MSVVFQTIIYLISIIGIFFIIFIFTDEDVKNVNKNEKSKDTIVDVTMYNINDEDAKLIVDELEKSTVFNELVDIVNIYQKFDK